MGLSSTAAASRGTALNQFFSSGNTDGQQLYELPKREEKRPCTNAKKAGQCPAFCGTVFLLSGGELRSEPPGAAEVEIAVVQVEVIEADVAEVAVVDVRLRAAVAAEA